METLPYILDLAGTFVFALSGAMAGVRRKLDLFGVLVLSFAAANTGGITRDILIGAVPPGAISDWHYLGVSLVAGTRHILLYVRDHAAMESGAAVRCRWIGALCGFRNPQGARVWTKPDHGHLARHVDGNWRRHGARYFIGRDSPVLRADLYAVAAFAWCGHSRDRKRASATCPDWRRLSEGRSASDFAFSRYGAVGSFRSLGGGQRTFQERDTQPPKDGT